MCLQRSLQLWQSNSVIMKYRDILLQHTHTNMVHITLWPTDSHQAPVNACDRFNCRKQTGVPRCTCAHSDVTRLPQACIVVRAFVFHLRLVVRQFKNVLVSNLSHANLCDRFDCLFLFFWCTSLFARERVFLTLLTDLSNTSPMHRGFEQSHGTHFRALHQI